MSFLSLTLLASTLTLPEAKPASPYFTITVVDERTGRGVPLVELRTVNNIRYFTDSNGIVAFAEPGLMNQRVFFIIGSHGYEFPKDGFGFRGQALDVKEGGSAQLKIKRINVAQRLYRVTGGGIYRDSVLVGHPVPLRQPVLNGLVFGSDSVVNAVYRGQVYWFWGDTNQPAYPLGNFNVPGATSELPDKGGLDPEVGVDLHYFVDDRGFASPTAPLPGPGPTWIGGPIAVRDASGKERLFTHYVKIRLGTLEAYQRGVAEFNDRKHQFEKVATFDKDAPIHVPPNGHPFRYVVDGTEYVYFAIPFPLIRVKATVDDLRQPSRYESFSPLQEGSRLDRVRFDRAADGTLCYRWKTNTPPLGPQELARLVQQGKLKAAEALPALQDIETGKPFLAHAGSVHWNEYRKRWVMITAQQFGTSMLGETWFAEADTPLGPWGYARKIVTHDRYSFYNPKQHPMFDKDKGRLIFFEGTYANTFSGNADQTPRYDYNQIMYKLDLTDPRVNLPVPIYLLVDGGVPNRFGPESHLGTKPGNRTIAFFALDRPKEGTVPVFAWQTNKGEWSLRLGAPPAVPGARKADPVFHALPAGTRELPKATVPLYEFVGEDGIHRAYSTDKDWFAPGYRRGKDPLCLVWRNPTGNPVPWQ